MADTFIGSGTYTGNGDFYYFGGGTNSNYRNEIWHINLTSVDGMTVIATLPYPNTDSSSVWDGGDSVYVAGGWDTIGSSNYMSRKIHRFSKSDSSVSTAAEMPTGRTSTSLVHDPTTDTVFIFGGIGPLNDILSYHIPTGVVTKLPLTLPSRTYSTCSVWTGTEAYILGGWPVAEPFNNVTQFSPSDGRVGVLDVDGWPSGILVLDANT